MKRPWLYFLALFIILLALGIMLGDAENTFGKAVKICLECIGMG